MPLHKGARQLCMNLKGMRKMPAKALCMQEMNCPFSFLSPGLGHKLYVCGATRLSEAALRFADIVTYCKLEIGNQRVCTLVQSG